MGKIKFLSISSRISIILGIIILLTMGLFSIFSLVQQKNDAISSISENTDQLSKTTEKILRFSMLENRREEISLAVNSIVNTEGIESARILDHKGIIHYSSDQSELKKNLSENNPLCIRCHNAEEKVDERSDKDFVHYKINEKQNLIYFSLPIYNATGCYNSDCHFNNGSRLIIDSTSTSDIKASVHTPSQTILGFIEIVVSIKKVISDLKETRLQLILLSILFAVLASVVAYFSIRRLVGKPVKNLVEGTKRVAKGDFGSDIPAGKAELGLLAESFNKMQKQLIVTQSQLIESEKLASIGKLSDEIANEINNPLTGIIIYSESLIEDIESSGNKKDDIETIRDEALKIRESVKNILSLTGTKKPDFKNIDIGEVINHSVSVVEKLSNFRNIKIICQIPRYLPEVSADPGLMEQVFLNLLLISSEAMQTGGLLNINAYFFEENPDVEIIFSYSGKGISEEVLQKVFNPDQSFNMEKFEKAGISLSVCKDIIEMNKGKLIINSTASSTSFTIKLPV